MANQPSSLTHFHRLLGNWTTEATHPLMPGVVVHGTALIEWLEGERFLVIRSRTDHPKFPDSISILGQMDQDREGDTSEADAGLLMHYFDSRGVFRSYYLSVGASEWRYWREAPGFSQRFTGTFSADGGVIEGQSELRQDDVNWKKDLQITYRRRR